LNTGGFRKQGGKSLLSDLFAVKGISSLSNLEVRAWQAREDGLRLRRLSVLSAE
jgi:hypothetical protein